MQEALPLPNEVIEEIFGYLGVHDLCSCCLVCRRFLSIARNQSLWDGMFIPQRPMNVAPKGPVPVPKDPSEGEPEELEIEHVNPFVPAPRVCHVAVVVGSSMWIHGGDLGDPYGGIIRSVQSDVWRFNIENRTWTHAADTGHCLTEHAAVALPDDSGILIFGGNKGTGGAGASFSNTLLRFDFSTLTMSVVEPTSDERPPPRSAHSTVMYRGKLILFGGWNSTISMNDLWEFDIATCAWRLLETTGEKPSPRRTHKAAVSGTKMFVFGGYCDGTDPSSFCDIFELDFETLAWRKLPATGDIPSGRARSTLVADPRRPLLFLIGGWDRKDHFSDLFAFSTQTFRWRQVSSNLTPIVGGIAQHSTVMYRRWIIIFGGYYATSRRLSNTVLRAAIAERECTDSTVTSTHVPQESRLEDIRPLGGLTEIFSRLW